MIIYNITSAIIQVALAGVIPKCSYWKSYKNQWIPAKKLPE